MRRWIWFALAAVLLASCGDVAGNPGPDGGGNTACVLDQSHLDACQLR